MSEPTKTTKAAKQEEDKLSPLYAMFETDKDLEVDGLTLDYGKGIKIVIARAGGANRKYASRLEQKMRPYRAAMNSGTMQEDTALKFLIEAYAEAVILGWEGVTDRNGNPLPFTKANAIKLLTDLPELFSDIRGQADRVANFTLAGAQEDAKS